MTKVTTNTLISRRAIADALLLLLAIDASYGPKAVQTLGPIANKIHALVTYFDAAVDEETLIEAIMDNYGAVTTEPELTERINAILDLRARKYAGQ